MFFNVYKIGLFYFSTFDHVVKAIEILKHNLPCDFWLFPKLRSCRYETIKEMKEAVTKIIDTLTQEDFDGAFEKLLELYNMKSESRL